MVRATAIVGSSSEVSTKVVIAAASASSVAAPCEEEKDGSSRGMKGASEEGSKALTLAGQTREKELVVQGSCCLGETTYLYAVTSALPCLYGSKVYQYFGFPKASHHYSSKKAIPYGILRFLYGYHVGLIQIQ